MGPSVKRRKPTTQGATNAKPTRASRVARLDRARLSFLVELCLDRLVELAEVGRGRRLLAEQQLVHRLRDRGLQLAGAQVSRVVVVRSLVDQLREDPEVRI